MASKGNKKIIQSVKDATNSNEEDILAMLLLCDNDVNECVNRLLDSEYQSLQCP